MSIFLDNFSSNDFFTLLFLATTNIFFIVVAIILGITIIQKEKTKRTGLIVSKLSNEKLIELLVKILETEILTGNDPFSKIINITKKILK